MPSLINHSILLSPLQKLSIENDYNLSIFIKRDDLNHHEVMGNKLRKLFPNLKYALLNKHKSIITFGGAFSNHIAATAAACYDIGIPSAAIIRGEIDENNPTIQFCKSKNMALHAVTRSDYRLKADSPIIQNIINNYPNPFIVPEGGSNQLALSGLESLCHEINYQLNSSLNYIVVPVGTGGTIAGLIKHSNPNTTIVGIPVLRHNLLFNDISLLFGETIPSDKCILLDQYTFGGYAKTKPELIAFMQSFYYQSNIKLDPIYNAKAMYGLFDLVKQNFFAPNSTIVYIHTGGLQGINGFEYQNNFQIY